jgi:hypothetical protein
MRNEALVVRPVGITQELGSLVSCVNTTVKSLDAAIWYLTIPKPGLQVAIASQRRSNNSYKESYHKKICSDQLRLERFAAAGATPPLVRKIALFGRAGKRIFMRFPMAHG